MVSWGEKPEAKIEAGATNISSDHVSSVVRRPENGVSYVKLVANDYKGCTFIADIDAFTVIKVSYRYGTDSYTKVFEGKTGKVGPILSPQRQTAEVTAYGYGLALNKTHNNNQYGEQISSSLDVPEEVWDDIVDNYVNKSLVTGNNTGYALTKTKMASITNPTIRILNGQYRSNRAVLDEVCRLYNAYQAGSAGVHWFVDPSKNLWIDTIAAHTVDTTNWPTWWNTDQAGSTLVEGTDIHSYDFRNNLAEYANNIIVVGDFRKPGYDWICEDTGASEWGNDNCATLAASTTEFIVGSHSLHVEVATNQQGQAYWPSSEDANWDMGKIGSEQSIPSVEFYYFKDSIIVEAATFIRMFTTEHDTNFYQASFANWASDPDNEWIHVSLPIGPYWESASESKFYRWTTGAGSPDWSNIDGVAFDVDLSGVGFNGDLYIDDFHIKGKLARSAYNSTSITAYDEHQKVLRMDVAIDDSLDAAVDTGTAGRLAYAELLRCDQTDILVGQVTTPLMIDALPGQLWHIHADEYSAGNFRVNKDMRGKEIVHSVSSNSAQTTLDLTSDVKNTFAIGYDVYLQTLAKAYHIDPDAMNLKSTGIDVLVDILSRDYA